MCCFGLLFTVTDLLESEATRKQSVTQPHNTTVEHWLSLADPFDRHSASLIMTDVTEVAVCDSECSLPIMYRIRVVR